MALTDAQIIACWERACYGLGKYEKFARAIESAACAERDARIAELEQENAKLKTVPMKYRRMAFNAELQEKVAGLERQHEALLAAVKTVKFNLMHHRRFGTDSMAAWRTAACNTEADLEEAITKAAES